jgi:outer membrane protein TolC
LIVPACAQDAPPRRLTAELAASIALDRSPRLRAARARARAEELSARAEARPENPRVTAADRSGPGGRHAELGVSFDLWSLIGFGSRRRAGAAETERAQAALAEEALALAEETKQEFYEAQSAEASLTLTKAQADAARALADLAEAQRRSGNVAQLDVDREEADAEEAALDVDRAQARLDAARAELGRLLLVPPGTPWPDMGELAEPAAADPDAAALSALARDRRPSRLAALAAARAARAALFDRENRTLGVFRAGAGYERELGGEKLFGPEVELEMPAFGRAALLSGAARAGAEAADADAEEANADVDAELGALKARLDAAARRARRLSSAIVPRRAAVTAAAQTRAGAMLASLRELLAAKRAETASRLSLVEARRDYWTSRAALERAVGGSFDETEKKP